MIPIKNKKKSFEDTVQEMRDFSMKYIEKYAPSKQQLRTYLLKKYSTEKNARSKFIFKALIKILLSVSSHKLFES